MKRMKGRQKIRLALLLGLAGCLISLNTALAASGMDVINKWVWSANSGWINFAPDNGGVMVYSDHLEGYAWSENLGWIRMGTATLGGAHTYANDAASTYGVNNDGVGNLSGSAWSTNTGWINFTPANGGVWVDPVSGGFDGYAWGENVGWIKFNGTAANASLYQPQTAWRGDLLAAYQYGMAALISTHRPGAALSNGLNIANLSFTNDPGDGIIFGHNNAAFAYLTTHLPGGVDKRWARIWQMDVNNGAGVSGGQVTLTFDIPAAGGQDSFSSAGNYTLLKRATGSVGNFTVVNVIGSPSFSADSKQITFTVDVSQLGSEFTLGLTNHFTNPNNADGDGSSDPEILPASGFAPDRVTLLAKQDVPYADMDPLRLEIPLLGIHMNIVGVPQTGNSWDVSWLGQDAGYLAGSAYPTHAGNSVLTGHVWDARNQPGPFVHLGKLKYGDEIKILAFGQVYTYEVRENRLVEPGKVNRVMKHEELSWVTLLTCENYDADSMEYAHRRLVRAVLVNVTSGE